MLFLMLMAISALALTGCSDDDNPVATGMGTGAMLRVVHASPNAPTVDIGVVDGETFTALPEFSNVSFGQASAGPGLEVPAAVEVLPDVNQYTQLSSLNKKSGSLRGPLFGLL